MYESTLDELYNLWDAISPGGYVIIDDWRCGLAGPRGAAVAAAGPHCSALCHGDSSQQCGSGDGCPAQALAPAL